MSTPLTKEDIKDIETAFSNKNGVLIIKLIFFLYFTFILFLIYFTYY